METHHACVHGHPVSQEQEKGLGTEESRRGVPDDEEKLPGACVATGVQGLEKLSCVAS